MRAPLGEREHKYVLTAREHARLLAAVRAHAEPIVYDAARPIAYARTTYLDTDDLRYLQSEGKGLSRRLRVREYAAARALDDAPELTGECYLEIKERAGTRRSKTRQPFDPELVPERVSPRLSTWYRRASFRAPGVRITIDYATRFSHPVPVGAPLGEDRVFAHGPPVILELKLAGEPPAWLLEAARGIPEATGFSKFSVGMRPLMRRVTQRSRP